MKTEHSIGDFLFDLVGFLSRDQLKTNDVSARIGPVSNDPGGLVPMKLRATFPGISAVTLARYPDSDVPYLVEMELADKDRPTLADLTVLFGEYQRSLTDHDLPSEVIFYPSLKDKPWQVAVIAQLEPSSRPAPTALVARIDFRRDPSAYSNINRTPA